MSSPAPAGKPPSSTTVAHHPPPAPPPPPQPTHADPAARAVDHTNAWKPALDRRQSWNKEDHKHSLQMSGLADAASAPGFTEKPAA